MLEVDHSDVMITNFLGENRPSVDQIRRCSSNRRNNNAQRKRHELYEELQLSTSQGNSRPKDRVDQMIREVEQGNANIFPTLGRQTFDLKSQFLHSAMICDENYVLAAHLDETMKGKIEKNEYVDLAKLIPKD